MDQDTSGNAWVKAPSGSIIDILILLAGQKRLWLGVPMIAALLAFAISFALPNWYTATARIMPPQQSQSNAAAILGQTGSLAGAASQAVGLKSPSDIYVAMLKSRSVADGIISKFDLLTVYRQDRISNARRELARNTVITAGREGVITIEVIDKDPQRATNIANAYIEELRALTLSLAMSEAGQRRLFFENQLKTAKESLAAVEVDLKTFMEKSGAPSIEGQIGLTVAAAAALRGQITAKEIQLSSMRTFATDSNPEIRRATQELNALRTELSKMERNGNVASGDVLLPFDKAGAVGLEFKRRFRDLKYSEALFEALAKQYEIAKIDEAKDATLVQVLDKAIVPDERSWPRRRLIVLLVFLISVALATGWILFNAWWRRLQAVPEQAAQLRRLVSSLRLGR